MTTQPTLTPSAFVEKWRGVTTTEKASSQSHFIDMCRMLGEPTPHEADPTGEHYAFEKRVTKGRGGDGFADVWKSGFFAWDTVDRWPRVATGSPVGFASGQVGRKDAEWLPARRLSGGAMAW